MKGVQTSIWKGTTHCSMIDIVVPLKEKQEQKKNALLVELVTTGTHTTGDKESTLVCIRVDKTSFQGFT